MNFLNVYTQSKPKHNMHETKYNKRINAGSKFTSLSANDN